VQVLHLHINLSFLLVNDAQHNSLSSCSSSTLTSDGLRGISKNSTRTRTCSVLSMNTSCSQRVRPSATSFNTQRFLPPLPPLSLCLCVQELTWSIKGGTRWPQLCKNASLTRPHADARSSTSSEVLVPSDFNSSQSGIQDQPILVHEKWVGRSCQLNDANFLCLRWNNQLRCYWH